MQSVKPHAAMYFVELVGDNRKQTTMAHIRFLHNSPGYLVSNIYSSTYITVLGLGLYVVASEHYVYIVYYSKTSLIQAAWDQGVPITWKMPETCILCSQHLSIK